MTQYLIAEVRERLKALLEKARPLPWNGALLFPENHTEANYELADAAVNALPALLTHLDAVEGENARLRALIANPAFEAHRAIERAEEAEKEAELYRHMRAIANGFNSITEAITKGKRTEAAESQLASQAASLAEMREEIARIIDPAAWGVRQYLIDAHDRATLNESRRRADLPDEDGLVAASLAKADAIIALQNKAES